MELEKTIQDNISQNREHYDAVYNTIDVHKIIKILNNLESFLQHHTTTEISWVGMYYQDFKSKIQGQHILELGCGDCINAAVMAALGAKVVANDISDKSGDIITALNANYKFEHPIVFVSGDFTKVQLKKQSFDFIIGKAFLHHLTLDLEFKILQQVATLLKPDGEARFFETAVNSKLLDALRWAIPMNDRPSKLFSPKAFKQWEAQDPHPPRDNSTKHYKTVGFKLFDEVHIVPLGIFERLNRILPFNSKHMARFKRLSLRFENYLPIFIRRFGARSQTIMYKNPKVSLHV